MPQKSDERLEIGDWENADYWNFHLKVEHCLFGIEYYFHQSPTTSFLKHFRLTANGPTSFMTE
jgi:hypothetical protein